MPPYDSDEQKRHDAYRMKRDETISWEVLADDVDGTVHRAYGLLADPAYVIGTDGRVSFYNYWTHVPTLHRAIEALVARGGRGAIGEHKMVHPLATIADGWRALRRGLPQSFWDLETAAPGTASVPWIGYQVRGVLAPVALVGEPWPREARAALWIAAAAIGLGMVTTIRRRPRRGAVTAALRARQRRPGELGAALRSY